MRNPLIAAALLALSTFTLAAPPAARFKVQDTWKLGGDGSWDYLTVDSSAHLLYIARLTRIMVVDTATGKLVTEISGLEHAHGVALAGDGNRGYISDGDAEKVLVFDRSSHKIIGSIPAGKNPDSILLEPSRNLLFAFNGRSNSATVADASRNTVLSTLPLPGKPEFSVTDGEGNVFVNIEDTSQVLRIDAASLQITASWPLAPCKAPSGLAIDRSHHRLFSVCDNQKMAVVDSTTGKLVATVPIGEGADAVAYDDSRSLIFTSNGESGNLSVIQQVSPERYTVLQTVPTKMGARTLAVDSSNGAVYTVSAKLGPKPPATKVNPKARPPIIPDSFVVLVLRQ
ncbi:MAG: YncE family protein [Acidobacteriota bacterium]|nr:YncE family protein [Acidobacteriota bacterium]